MTINFSKKQHLPVLLNEAIRALNIKKTGIYIDGTFGCGGHSSLILKNLNSFGKLFSLDKDPTSIKNSNTIIDKKFKIINDSFSNMLNISKKYNIYKNINGILLDLGISSQQINSPERGFSFMKNGPLDMRINQKIGIPASKWLMKATTKEIETVLFKFGEERYAKQISRSIKSRNKNHSINTTKELSDLISNVMPKHTIRFKHPATRSFQAIRIHINNELEEIKIALNQSLKILAPKGRLVVISFHSLEDRIVKNFFNIHSKNQYIPKGIPITEKNINLLKPKKLKLISRIFPTNKEIFLNPKSRSAVLRTAELLQK